MLTDISPYACYLFACARVRLIFELWQLFTAVMIIVAHNLYFHSVVNSPWGRPASRSKYRWSCTRVLCHPNGVVLGGGDLSPIDLDCLSTSSGLVTVVNFATRGTSILDNCLAKHPELFNDPLYYKDWLDWGVIPPPGNKIKPIRSKCRLRDFIEHYKIKFTSELEDYDWTSLINAPDVEIATSIFNKELHNLMDKCFPVRRMVMWSPVDYFSS